VLAITAIDAVSRGDLDLGEQRCELALQADRRLHTSANADVENLVCQARADSALVRGAFADSVAFSEQAAEVARANGNLAVAAVNLAEAAQSSTFAGDDGAAVPLAFEALALARQVGMPNAIIYALLILGIALADTDPDEARACLSEGLDRSTELGYENANYLALATLLTSRVEERDATLGIAGGTIRELHWARQHSWLAAILTLVARALSPTRPDAAAIIQGTVRGISYRFLTVTPSPQSNPTPPDLTPGSAGGYFGEVRHETTRLLASVLGEQRSRKLRAEGEAMDEDQAVAYTLAQIDLTLAGAIG
jgi:hypothetical protein